MDKIRELIERKRNGIDCSEEDSAEIKGYVRETLIQPGTGQVETISDIQELFPLEYGEAIDESTASPKDETATFKVRVIRVSYGCMDIEVEATDEDDAKSKAISVAGDREFTEQGFDFDVENIEKK